MLKGLFLIGTLQVVIACIVALLFARVFLILRQVKENKKK
jgi:hypothetical protein